MIHGTLYAPGFRNKKASAFIMTTLLLYAVMVCSSPPAGLTLLITSPRSGDLFYKDRYC